MFGKSKMSGVRCFLTALCLAFMAVSGLSAAAQSNVKFDDGLPQIDRQVSECLRQKGIGFLPRTDVICYNAMIFPDHLKRLKTLPQARRIIFTSSGGNMLVARRMNEELRRRDTPVTIAGPCLSSCAMLIIPGLNRLHIHKTALIASHGITNLGFDDWYVWEHQGRRPSAMQRASASIGMDDDYMFYKSANVHVEQHLKSVGVDVGYINRISDRMSLDARRFRDCLVKPSDYWTIMTPDHIQAYLGRSVVRMERFVSGWSDPLNRAYTHIGVAISDQSYIMHEEYASAGCPPQRSAGASIMASNAVR
ncbi:MAG: hypothetical protein CMK06_14865 [Ponticaulis sp.]|nr:hypothetical protein [Ponticaulis sp.]